MTIFWFKFATVFVIISLIKAKFGIRIHIDVPKKPVKDIDLKAYMGRWYQTHASIMPNITYEVNSFCVNADYTFKSPMSFCIWNSLNTDMPNGLLESMAGNATLCSPSEPGKWIVEFSSESYSKTKSHQKQLPWKRSLHEKPPHTDSMVGPYWIIKLSKINKYTGLYDWAVISVPFGFVIFIIARDVESFMANTSENLLKQ